MTDDLMKDLIETTVRNRAGLVADYVTTKNRLNDLLYSDRKPLTRWERWYWRLYEYRARISGAWAVLMGRASARDD